MLSYFRLYYIQLKEVKILWGSGPGGPDMRAGGWGPDNPNTLQNNAKQNNLIIHDHLSNNTG